VRAYLAMMRARRALILRRPGHTTRRGTAARPRWMPRHRAPGGRRGTTWCGSGSFSLCEPRRQGEYRNRLDMVAKMATRCGAEPADLYAATRSAGGRICR
jgi:hypothetical protein